MGLFYFLMKNLDKNPNPEGIGVLVQTTWNTVREAQPIRPVSGTIFKAFLPLNVTLPLMISCREGTIARYWNSSILRKYQRQYTWPFSGKKPVPQPHPRA
jgi:hypothetical protein